MIASQTSQLQKYQNKDSVKTKAARRELAAGRSLYLTCKSFQMTRAAHECCTAAGHWPWGSCTTDVLRPETTSENRYCLTGYDGSHVRIGRKLRTAALALCDEQLQKRHGHSLNWFTWTHHKNSREKKQNDRCCCCCWSASDVGAPSTATEKWTRVQTADPLFTHYTCFYKEKWSTGKLRIHLHLKLQKLAV